MSESPAQTKRASERLRHGVCDCDYPCSCMELDGVRYGSWQEALDAKSAEVEQLAEEKAELQRGTARVVNHLRAEIEKARHEIETARHEGYEAGYSAGWARRKEAVA